MCVKNIEEKAKCKMNKHWDYGSYKKLKGCFSAEYCAR